MENLVEDNGICDCHYLLTMRLALQREVDSPFGINSIYDLGDWCAPWWRKPVSYADLDAFFESDGCSWLRQSIGIGSWRGDAGEDEKAARIIRASRDLMKMGSNRARSSCLRSTWMARRRNCAALARPTYTACRGYGGYYVSTILAL